MYLILKDIEVLLTIRDNKNTIFMMLQTDLIFFV